MHDLVHADGKELAPELDLERLVMALNNLALSYWASEPTRVFAEAIAREYAVVEPDPES
jgi:hypothetical protein